MNLTIRSDLRIQLPLAQLAAVDADQDLVCTEQPKQNRLVTKSSVGGVGGMKLCCDKLIQSQKNISSAIAEVMVMSGADRGTAQNMSKEILMHSSLL